MTFQLLKWKIIPLVAMVQTTADDQCRGSRAQRKEQKHRKTKLISTTNTTKDTNTTNWTVCEDWLNNCLNSTKEVQGGNPMAPPCLCFPSQQLQGAQASCLQSLVPLAPPALGPRRARPEMKRETAPSAPRFLPVPDLPPTGIRIQCKTSLCLSCW